MRICPNWSAKNISWPTEMTESLTGFDEIAIEQQFRRPLEDLSNTGTVRALAFVQFRRDGLDDKAAHEKAMGATFGALDDMFDTSQVEGPKA